MSLFALTWPGDSDYEFPENVQNDLVQRCHFIEGACQVVGFGWHYTFKAAFLSVCRNAMPLITSWIILSSILALFFNFFPFLCMSLSNIN